MALRLRNRDVPLATDSSTRFVPWIIGTMVFLSALVLAVALIHLADQITFQRCLAGGHHQRAGIAAYRVAVFETSLRDHQRIPVILGHAPV